jgi:DNA-binding NarL/FixJ family response regulator
MKQTRVLITDDHYFVRKGIRMFLEAESSIDVVGEAESGQEVIQQVAKLQPDVILMDISMPQGDGIEAISIIKQNRPNVKVIVLTMYEHQSKVIAALVDAGADGYLLKDADDSALLQAIEAVQRGDMPLHPRIARQLVKGMAQQNKPLNSVFDLTEREKKVLQLVAQGLSNKETAQVLNLSGGTVKIHMSNILNKLNVSSRTEAVVRAIQLGLITIDQND